MLGHVESINARAGVAVLWRGLAGLRALGQCGGMPSRLLAAAAVFFDEISRILYCAPAGLMLI
jgi:hypothetical protein